jgi:hypothetical protein
MLLSMGSAAAQEQLPILPSVFSGTATAGGKPVPNGFTIVARIDTRYVSAPVEVTSARYEVLVVAPEDSALIGQTITFDLEGVTATQTATFQSGVVNTSLNLTFPKLPDPTPTPTLTPTLTPIPTATPRAVFPAVYSGTIVIAGGGTLEGAVLIARIGTYESLPARIDGDTYSNLVIDPQDEAFDGLTIEFVLNGVVSRTADIYVSGAVKRDLTLVFFDVPTPTPEPTATPTPLPPTATPSITPTPTPAPVSPTLTPVPVSPTLTPVPVSPTLTPLPTTPTPTVAAPTSTATPSRATATPSVEATPVAVGGTCNAPAVDAPITTGMANFLLLVVPLAALGAYRRLRR